MCSNKQQDSNLSSELIEKLIVAQENRIQELLVYAEKHIHNISFTWNKIIPVTVGFISIISLFFVFYGIKSINDVRKEAKEVARFEVNNILKDNKGLVINVKELSKELETARNQLKVTKETIEALNIQASNEEALQEDVSGLYSSLSNSDINRSLKLKNLKHLISLGKKGFADPNLLYNSSSRASKLDFDFQALQLLSIASKLDPKPIYILRRSRLENVFGASFELVGNELVRSEKDANTIRGEAWQTVKDTIITNPIQDAQLSYSELWNIAERSNYIGYQQDAINLILGLEKKHQNNLPSYAFVILAELYARQSSMNWKENTWLSVNKALTRFAIESPKATWYKNTRKDLCFELADWLDAEEMMNIHFEKYNLEPCNNTK